MSEFVVNYNAFQVSLNNIEVKLNKLCMSIPEIRKQRYLLEYPR